MVSHIHFQHGLPLNLELGFTVTLEHGFAWP